ncbi:MAG: S41 family peptidase [Bacteroidales bacterium]|nr:S41 family peptidase [Bacteroidales bacterium]
MKSKTKTIRFSLVLMFLLFLPFGFSGYIDKDFELSKNLDIYHTLMRELNMFYVDETDPGELVKSSIDNMLARLDPYTVYIPESRMEDLELMTTGEYGGVGALIRQRNDDVMITDPYEDFPAHKAGLRAGDIIRKIDGRSVSDLKSAQISELMKGQVGTSLSIQVFRPHDEKEIKVEMVREKIRISNVPFYEIIDEQTGYIRLAGFTQGAAREVLDAFTEMKKDGISQLILDLRSNPGGLLIEAVDIMNIFVPQNEEIVRTMGKVKQWNHTYYCRREAIDTLMPVAVLINSKSASAAEIIAGAMQDLDRGVVIGQRSFGKGLVQTTRNLSYNSKLKITTAKYYIPSGRCIQALDYSHRRDDGSVGKIPDSLITEFKTKNGRVVYDGGGILPDFTLETRTLSMLTTAMLYQDKFFDFATKIRNTRSELDKPSDFVLTEKDYQEFVGQLERDSFRYETGSERKLEELIRIVKREKYEDVAGEKLKELQELLKNDVKKDVEVFEEEIKSLLSDEIIGRYYSQKGRIAFMLRDDPAILKAIEELKNQ